MTPTYNSIYLTKLLMKKKGSGSKGHHLHIQVYMCVRACVRTRASESKILPSLCLSHKVMLTVMDKSAMWQRYPKKSVL